MKKTYRDYLYGSYHSHLSNVMIFENLEKEYISIEKYFKKNYLSHFPQNKSANIIDIGCGNGAYLNACKSFGYKSILGVDLSENNVEICKKNGIPCEHSDGKKYLENRINSFDVILYNDVIEHLTKDELFETLEVMKSALKDDGIIIIKTANMANPYTGIAGRYIDMTHELGFTEISMDQVLHSLGFSDTKIYGADIYIKNNPIYWVAKFIELLFSFKLYIISYLYGRKSIRIFAKNLIAVVKK